VSDRLALDGGQPVHPGEPIPLCQIVYGDEELQAIQEVLQSGALSGIATGAHQIADFEQEFAAWAGTRHAIACSSGTAAQHISMAAIGVGPGDEVIVPTLTFISTAYTPLLHNAIPIFADVDETVTLDPADVRRKVTARTRAIVPVHWFGHPAAMDELGQIAQEHNLRLVEDCAHANGTRYKGRPAGKLGDAACWSLQETKVMTALGEGGVLTTDDDELAARARMFRNHGEVPSAEAGAGGWHGRYQVMAIGNHYRPTEIQAAFAREQLRRVDGLWGTRKACSDFYDQALAGVPGLLLPQPRDYATLSYAYYPLRFQLGAFRQPLTRIAAAFLAEGVRTLAIGLDELCHVHPLFTEQRGRGDLRCPFQCPHYEGRHTLRYEAGMFPVAERIAQELLLIPLHPALTTRELEDVVEVVRKVAKAYGE